ncbi:hypothetical protein [Psychromonas sp. KJ10-2]|uniref:hypothetical protein n=1 Tax=Psychromonas sp. KJ10-2 TaxID=3391822 RepID=UPI0039B53F96
MFTFYEGELRRISFFYYISLVLFIGGIFGNLYSFPISEGINISGGNICYGAFMMTSVLFVLVEKDLQIFKQIIRLVVTIDIVNIALSSIVAKTLNTPNVINPHQTSSALFDVSIPFIILGGVLIIVELFSYYSALIC